MAEFVIGRLKFVWRSAWTTATLYRKDDVVRYGGKSYVAIANHTASADFYTDTANWDLMTDGVVWNNTWTPATKINLGDIYKYGNNTYICTTEHTSGSTFDFANFDIFTESTRWTGAYVEGTYYYLNDLMKWGSHVYITTTEHDSTGETVPNTLNFTLYVPGLTWENTWTDATLYQINDLVKYGNNIYICIQQHTSSGDINYSYFNLFLPGLNFEDTWDVATNYQTGDIVTYGGYSYVAEQDSVGEIPYNNSANWKVLTTGYSYQNVWSNATAYKTGDVVRYGGNTYVASADTTAGQQPTLTAFWDLLTEGLSFKGTWDVATQYLIGEVVEYSTNSYRAIQDTVGNQPDTSPAQWQIVAQGDSVATLTTQGDILTHNGTQLDRLARGATGSTLTVNTNNDLEWTAVSTTVLHVAKTGLDTNPGSKALPFLTIKHACSQATAGDVIFVEQGVYEEDLPIQVPANVSLYGDSLRGCEVRPQVGDEAETMFLLNNANNIRNFKFTGLNGGIVMALDPAGSITTQSPYIQNCTSVNTASIGIKIDGSVQTGGYHSILANDFTQINNDGVGVHVSNGGRAELVSVFTYYCDKGFFAETGGFIRALNCSNSYGEYGAVADGTLPGETPITIATRGEQLRYVEASLTGTLAEGDTVTGVQSGAQGTIIRVNDSTQRIKIVSISGPFTDGEACTTTGGAGFDLRTPGETGQTGYLFELSGTYLQSDAIPVGSNIVFSGDATYYTVTAVTNDDLANGYATVRINPEKTTDISDGQTVTITSEFSNIRLTGHDFLNIGTGDFTTTNYPNTPTQSAQQERETDETNGGRVYYVTTDQSGNFRVGNQFRVDQATGNATLNADAFDLSGLTELQLGSIGAQLGATINEFSTDTNLTGDSNTAVPTEHAVKGYVDNQIANNAFQINKESTGTPGTFARVETKDDDTIEFKIKDAVRSVLGDQYLLVPKGTTAERPGSPVEGYLRYNTDLGFLEQYNAVGWAGIDAPPTVNNISGTVNEDSDTTITVNGTNFKTGSVVAIGGNALGGAERALATAYVGASQLTAVVNNAANPITGGQTFTIKVTNPSGLSNILDPAGTVDRDPVFSTAQGSTVATVFDGYAGYPNNGVGSISASDPDGGTVTFASSNMPTGFSIASDGTINNDSDPADVTNSTTYPFDVTATTDGDPAQTDVRSFNIIVNPALDGSTSAKAAVSANDIKTLTGTTSDGMYWIQSPSGAISTYCLMGNYSSNHGGGWTLAFNLLYGNGNWYQSSGPGTSDYYGFGLWTSSTPGHFGSSTTYDYTNNHRAPGAYVPFDDIMIMYYDSNQNATNPGSTCYYTRNTSTQSKQSLSQIFNSGVRDRVWSTGGRQALYTSGNLGGATWNGDRPDQAQTGDPWFQTSTYGNASQSTQPFELVFDSSVSAYGSTASTYNDCRLTTTFSQNSANGNNYGHTVQQGIGVRHEHSGYGGSVICSIGQSSYCDARMSHYPGPNQNGIINWGSNAYASGCQNASHTGTQTSHYGFAIWVR
jgi:predicted RecA/RadA family phage recombinase